jgi:CheY-like chemotaxis protein
MEQVQLLVADDDVLTRSQLALCVRDTVGGVLVLEAEDGAEAIQLGLQQRPEIALLDIEMPRLGGIEAAVTLRELHPRIRLGLRTGDPLVHRERAHEHGLPLFGKLELDRTLFWLRAQVERYAEPPPKLNLRCTRCGYGVLRSTPPRRCPMCQAEDAWLYAAPPAPTTVLSR